MFGLLSLLILPPAAAPVRAAENSNGIAYFRAQVKDLPGALAWLEKTFDWKESDRDGKRASVGDGRIRLVLDASAQDSPATIGLASGNVDADYQALLARGASSLAAPEDKAYGFRVASLKGPGALVFELEGPLVGATSGFQYIELAEGRGPSPRKTDTVRVRYVGTLSGGKVFERSPSGRAPMFPLTGVIACWTEGLQKMKPGGKARLVCPAGMAFGAKGRPNKIPPGATLTYEVELLEIVH